MLYIIIDYIIKHLSLILSHRFTELADSEHAEERQKHYEWLNI